MARFLQPCRDVKGFAASAALFLATLASATVSINSAYLSDDAAQPRRPVLGESFFVTAKITSTDGSPFRMTFQSPAETLTTPFLVYRGPGTVVWGPFRSLVAEGETIGITVDGQTLRPYSLAVAPILPNRAIEYFNPNDLSCSMTAQAAMVAGQPSDLEWWIPKPPTEGFQQLIASTGPGATATTNPFRMPVLVAGAPNAQFETRASSVRVNPDFLRRATWQDLRRLPSGIRPYLGSEAYAESSAPAVSQFARWSLARGNGYRSPYDAAKTLFEATVARLTYVDDCGKPSAVRALATGRGDCAYFVSLFVAACRNVGIPARAATGMTVGDDAWHVWAEFYLPNAGWIPVDPAYADGLCPDGSAPLYFGVIPELNQRVATTYGYTHAIGSQSILMLQSPAVIATNGARVAEVTDHATVRIAN